MGKNEETNDAKEVEEITADRVENGTTQYKVKWAGVKDETWEDEDKLECEEKIQEYLEAKEVDEEEEDEEDEQDDEKEETPPKKKKKLEKDGECEPDKIVGLHTLKDGKRELLVRWKGLSENEDSWEPEEKLKGTPVHDRFLLKQQQNKAKKEAEQKKGKTKAKKEPEPEPAEDEDDESEEGDEE